MTVAFLCLLAAWAFFCTLRFVRPYDRRSWAQRWRRLDVLDLVPVGAFFSPGVPTTEFFVLHRHLLAAGGTTPWREVLPVRHRSVTRAVWNPGKQAYRAKAEVARDLLGVATSIPDNGDGLPVRLLLDDAYLRLLRLVSAQPASPGARAVQFAVLAVDLERGAASGHLVSAAHALPPAS